ncbi:MAG: hypothetical protein RQ875_13730 [Vicingaceae bacterium]|nr:hypothetical protein [Vicingaceae bacterium]
MKKLRIWNIIEGTVLSLVLLFSVLKLVNIQSSGVFITFFLLVISVFYLTLGIKINNLQLNEDNNKALTLFFSIAITLLVSSTVLSLLFKLQLWALTDGWFLINLITSIIVLLIISINFLKSKKKYLVRLMVKLIYLIIISAFCLYVPSSKLIEIYHKDNPELKELKLQWLNNSEDKEIIEKLNNYKKDE